MADSCPHIRQPPSLSPETRWGLRPISTKAPRHAKLPRHITHNPIQSRLPGSPKPENPEDRSWPILSNSSMQQRPLSARMRAPAWKLRRSYTRGLRRIYVSVHIQDKHIYVDIRMYICIHMRSCHAVLGLRIAQTSYFITCRIGGFADTSIDLTATRGRSRRSSSSKQK